LEAFESADGNIIVLTFAVRLGVGGSLTPAESAVTALLLEGRTNAEIAQARGSSERTVANQAAKIYQKLGVGSRLELLVFAPLLEGERVW
jgi:DNA-binding NarL/FixJ family response regulator